MIVSLVCKLAVLIGLSSWPACDDEARAGKAKPAAAAVEASDSRG